jgi:hypothetical protein
MSKVALSSNALGTGTFTIASPNSNTDRTLTLPDNTGTILTTATAGVPVNGPLLVSGASTPATVNANTFTTFGSFGSSQIDTGNCFNLTNGRFTPQVAGYYQVMGSVGFSSNGVNSSYFGAIIYKNGSAALPSSPSIGASNGTVYGVYQTSSFVYLNGTTDYVQVYAYILGASATNVYAMLQAALIRSAT